MERGTQPTSSYSPSFCPPKGLGCSSGDPSTQAQLLAARKQESGAWLHALPMSSLGLRMDNDVILVAMGLRLGVLCAALIHANSVGWAWTGWEPMASIAVKALVATPATLDLMTSSKGLWLQQRLLLTWSQWGICRADGKRMVLPSCHGEEVVSLSGMSPAQIPSHHPISSWLSEKRVLWHAKQKDERQRSIRASCDTLLRPSGSRDNRGLRTRSALFPPRAWSVHQRRVRRGLVMPLPTPKDCSGRPEGKHCSSEGHIPSRQ